jgi:hypothetical protein
MSEGEMPGEMVYNGAPRSMGNVNNGVVRGMGGAPDVCPTCNRPYTASAPSSASYPASYSGTVPSRNYSTGTYRSGTYPSPSYQNGSYPPVSNQNGNYQPVGYQPTGYQPASYQSGNYQPASYQNGYNPSRNYSSGTYGTGSYQPRTSPQVDLSQLPPGRFNPKVISVTDEVVSPAGSTAEDAQASRPHRAVTE